MPTYSGFSDPGNTTATALNTASSSYIGGSLTSTSNIFQNSIGGSDLIDTYKFTVSSSSIVNLNLDGLSSNADLYLLNSTGGTITKSAQSGNTSESISTSLAIGTYYAQVYDTASNTNYNLSFSANPILDSGRLATDNTIANAYTIPTPLSGSNPNYSTTDFVGDQSGITDSSVIQDAKDFYKVDLASNGTLNITLNGLTADANLVLLRSGPSIIQSSNQTGTTSESIVTSSLAQGSYYIQVYANTKNVTNYGLQVAFTPDQVDNAGNTLAAARNITTLPSSFSDFVNSSDNLDYYRLDLTTLTNSDALVDISLKPTSANADLQLLDSSGSGVQSSQQSGIATDAIRRSLKAGVYYILVTPGTGAATNYDLSVSTTPIAADQAPNTQNTAKNIGVLTASQSLNEFVGNIDTDDYYTFSLNSNSLFSLNLSNLSDNADVQLIDSTRVVIQSSANTGTANETINTSLSAGTYLVRVYTSGLANTFYNLNLSTTAQAHIIDLNPGSNSSSPDNLTAWNNTLYFTANDGSVGSQLWKSGGTVANTTRITNINPGSFNPANLTVFNNKLYFTANDGTKGTELWVYDGTQSQVFSDINPNSASSNPSNLTVVGSSLFFTADNGTNGREVWVYDGTQLHLVKDIYSGVQSSSPTNLTAVNGKLYFAANNPSNGTELWVSDGTVNGTQVIDIKPGTLGSSPANLTAVGSTLYFTANNGTSGYEVWKYQTGVASLVKDVTPGNNAVAPSYLTAVGNGLYFVKYSDDFKPELWKTDGTSGGTVRVKNDTTQAPNIGFGASNLTAVGNTLYFIAPDNATGLELWKTDGTDANTGLVKDIWVGPDSNNSIPQSLINFNGSLYFAASDGSSREVWSSDGTALNTRKVSNIYANGNADPAKLTAVGTRLFFTATNGTNGTELWVI
ncbi:MAG: pre-peptidase C-terminal domain-containing protein [Nostoc sp. NOS(2021)]|uniref:ELWxxDGT repeat protein n=1 Tax=Nostoc sp. NOS(2021) TaxID=2815407 RepID=UPI0025D75ADB|nr:ELWxxDGT repeat protein [Nostoc sp. NOS(2021)]MBN3893921.1 pre-peptidase C-terminal domain-containing protein [Nostoc sp. NOS(2021)]